MRVVHALHGWPPAEMGGVGLYVSGIALAMQAMGHRVRLVTPGPRRGVEPVAAGGLAGARIGSRRPLRWRDTWAPRGLTGPLRRFLDDERPDVVHIHHLSGLGLRVPALARAAGARVVLTLHDYSLFCARGQLVDAEGALCDGPSARRCPPCAAGARPAGLTGAALARLRPRDARTDAAIGALEIAHARLAPSLDLARRFEALGSPPVALCPLPLLHPIEPAPTAPPGPVRLLFASAILPTKGPDRLVRAFARLPTGGATLTVAGPAPPFPGRPGFADALRREVEATPQATWLGPVAPLDMPALLAAHDVLVLPSTWPENSPLVVREATAAGLRVMVGSAGGAAELAPGAPTIPPTLDDAGLARLLAHEVAVGRGRATPRSWQRPDAHATWLLEGAYRAAECERIE